MRVWQFFWVLLVIVPLTVAWVFSVFDIFRRRDLSGWGKAAWFAAVILLPWLGTFVYLIFRPREVPEEVARAQTAARDAYEKSLLADQIAKLSSLHSQGELNDQEYAMAKSQLLLKAGGPSSSMTPGATAPAQTH